MAEETPQEILRKMIYSLRNVVMPCVLCQVDTLRKIVYQPTDRTKLIIGTPEEDYVRVPIVGLCELHDTNDDAVLDEVERAVLNTIRNPDRVLRLKDGKPYEETDEDNLPEV